MKRVVGLFRAFCAVFSRRNNRTSSNRPTTIGSLHMLVFHRDQTGGRKVQQDIAFTDEKLDAFGAIARLAQLGIVLQPTVLDRGGQDLFGEFEAVGAGRLDAANEAEADFITPKLQIGDGHLSLITRGEFLARHLCQQDVRLLLGTCSS